jgi:tripartite-type tricarboxylate transporter receptor subunit TctC
LAVAWALSVASASAQYPNKIVKIVGPAPPGGSTDIVARLVQPGLEAGLKQTVIVESRGGGGGYLGSEYVARSPADGYTLLIGGAFTTITATLQKNPGYNPRRDLVPVAIMASVPNMLVVGPRLKVNTVPELIAEAKANPGKLNIGSNGVGTTLHLSGELFKLRTGTKIEHIAYRGWGDCVAAMSNGEIDMMFDNLSTALPGIAAGKSRAMAVAAPARHRSLPDVPTLDELGIKDAEVISWFGIMVPGGTPQSVIDTLGGVLKTVSEGEEFQRKVAQQGMDVTFYGPAEAAKFWNREIEKWETVIRTAGIVHQ